MYVKFPVRVYETDKFFSVLDATDRHVGAYKKRNYGMNVPGNVKALCYAKNFVAAANRRQEVFSGD